MNESECRVHERLENGTFLLLWLCEETSSHHTITTATKITWTALKNLGPLSESTTYFETSFCFTDA